MMIPYLPTQIMAYQCLGHELCHVVAEYNLVFKIEPPPPTKVLKPPHRSLKVGMCLLPGPLRHPRPVVNSHPPGSAPRRSPSAISSAHVRAPSAHGHPWLPARSLPHLSRYSRFGMLVMFWCTVATCVRCLRSHNGAGYTSPHGCG